MSSAAAGSSISKVANSLILHSTSHPDSLSFQGLTILCDSSSIRLVSSGMYENVVTVSIKEAGEEDMNYEENIIMLCPGFN